MIFLLAAVMSGITIFLLLGRNPRRGVYWLFPTTAIVCMTWDVRWGSVSLIQVFFSLVALCVLFKPPPRQHLPRWWRDIAVIFFGVNVFGLLLSPFYNNPPLLFYADTTLRALNLCVGFFLLPGYIRTREEFKCLLLCLVWAALLPVLIGLYQSMTGQAFHYREASGSMRINGFYHDIVTSKFIYYDALCACILLLFGKLVNSKKYRLLLMFYILLLLFSCYGLLSKSVVATLLLWFLGLSIFSRSRGGVLMIILGVVAICAVMGLDFWDHVNDLYAKDIAVYEGERDSQYLLAGRAGLWELHWNMFLDNGLVAVLFGAGWATEAHNEFLRIIYMSGAIGCAVYAISLLFLLFYILFKLLRTMTLSYLAAGLLLISYLIECIGTVPGTYPSYNWFLWGMLGILLFNSKTIFPERNEASEQRLPLPACFSMTSNQEGVQ